MPDLGRVLGSMNASGRTRKIYWIAELITERPTSRFPGEREYTFRHALVRDGAYALLTPEDRALGHRLAGVWLEQSGEPGAVVLAEHFERGDERASGLLYRRIV